MDEYYYAKIAHNAYNDIFAKDGLSILRWEHLQDIEKQAWKACTAAITKEVNKYWYRSMKKKGGQ